MSSDEYEKLSGRLRAIERRLDSIEANSPPRASSEQSIVGPPEKVESENPALARPATLSELMFWLEEQVEVSKLGGRVTNDYWAGVRDNAILTLQRLKKLDQGPVAQCPVEYTECELYMSRFKKN